MARLSAYEQWKLRMGQSTGRMADGVEDTQKSQTGNAIKAKALMIENHNKAMQAGKWEEGLRRAGDAKWKRNMLEKGIPKIMTGINANAAEIAEKFAKVDEVGVIVKAKIATMPKGTLEDSVARSRESMIMQKDAWGKS